MNKGSLVEYRTLGRTGLNVSLLGMGTGGHNCLGQRFDPPVPEPEIHRLLHGVFDLGINLYDTAPGYKDSELILGRANVADGIRRHRKAPPI